tara:strand:+ start:42152 stop:43042 length:891 start_codon:yes stop_codon:yes gene_type:complete
MLVWFLAAMSLLIGGIAMQARVDIKLTQLHAERARAEAAADGAIQLALAQMMLEEVDQNLDTSLPFTVTYSEGGLPVRVRLIPLTGLVDLNQAPEELLERVFASAPGLEEAQALNIASTVVEWRSASAGVQDTGMGNNMALEDGDSEMRHARFEAIEDMLLVPGVDRRIFEALRDQVYVSQRGQPGVDWRAASVGVLQAVGDLTREQAREIAQRDVEETTAPAEFDLAFQQSDDLASYRVDAVVATGGQTFLRRRWVERGASGADRLPWRFFRSEPVRAVGGLEEESGREVGDARR